MARTPGADKAQTHERIVRAAAKAIRREGYAGTSVADVMKDAGLTHGGFYAHFKDREAMLAEALDFAAGESVDTLVGSAHVRSSSEGISALEAMVDGYLSDAHVKAKDAGCTIASLGSETRRQSPQIKKVATRHLKELVRSLADEIAAVKPKRRDTSSEALAALSTMVGALLIARIVDDPQLADDVRAAAKKAVLAH